MFTPTWIELIDLIHLTEQYIREVDTLINNHNVDPEAIPSVLQRLERIKMLNGRLKADYISRKA